MTVQVIHNFSHSIRWEIIRVIRKYPALEHVVDVSPHGLKRYAGFGIVRNHFCYIDEIYVAETSTLAPDRMPEGRRQTHTSIAVTTLV